MLLWLLLVEHSLVHASNVRNINVNSINFIIIITTDYNKLDACNLYTGPYNYYTLFADKTPYSEQGSLHSYCYSTLHIFFYLLMQFHTYLEREFCTEYLFTLPVITHICCIRLRSLRLLRKYSNFWILLRRSCDACDWGNHAVAFVARRGAVSTALRR